MESGRIADMSRCNYCIFTELYNEVISENGRIMTRHTSLLGGGTEIYVFPDGVDIPKRPKEGIKNAAALKRYQKAWKPFYHSWMKDIPYKCECKEEG